MSFATLALGCSDPAPTPADAGPVDAGPPADVGATQPVRLNFRGMVGTAPFACGTVYHGLGTTHTDWTPSDFRLYVHDVRLVTSAGTEVAVALDEDNLWQHAGVGLLDFEDATAGCMGGTAPTNDHLTGRAPVGSYTGLRFRLGVPFALNHADVSVAPSPLNVGGLFWSWASGYKFVKIDGQSTGVPTGYNVHLGSTGCTTDATGQVLTPCDSPNVGAVEFARFDAATQTIVADLAALVSTTNLDTNTADTAPGCMSSPMDPECVGIFAHFALPYDGVAAPAAQSFFVVQ